MVGLRLYCTEAKRKTWLNLMPAAQPASRAPMAPTPSIRKKAKPSVVPSRVPVYSTALASTVERIHSSIATPATRTARMKPRPPPSSKKGTDAEHKVETEVPKMITRRRPTASESRPIGG